MGVLIQALACLALVIILAGQAVYIMIESIARVVSVGAAVIVVAVPLLFLTFYLIG